MPPPQVLMEPRILSSQKPQDGFGGIVPKERGLWALWLLESCQEGPTSLLQEPLPSHTTAIFCISGIPVEFSL